jgi:hypothetical protein
VAPVYDDRLSAAVLNPDLKIPASDGFCVQDVKACRGTALDNDLTNLTENVDPNATPNPNELPNPSAPGVTSPTGSKLRAGNGCQNQKSFAKCHAPTPN